MYASLGAADVVRAEKEYIEDMSLERGNNSVSIGAKREALRTPVTD
jgi:hypothetical protein